MGAYVIIILSLFTVIGVKYLIDMVKFAMGYEINGKKREPMFGPKKWEADKEARLARRPAPQPEIHYEWEKELEWKPSNSVA